MYNPQVLETSATDPAPMKPPRLVRKCQDRGTFVNSCEGVPSESTINIGAVIFRAATVSRSTKDDR